MGPNPTSPQRLTWPLGFNSGTGSKIMYKCNFGGKLLSEMLRFGEDTIWV